MEKYKKSSNKHCTKSAFYAMSESRGITLIILIITIVVLIILAGVTISNITSDEGVLNEATHERDEATIANEKNILGNVVIEATDKFGDITEENLLTALSKNNVEITPSGGLYRIVFKDSNNLYKMNHQGEFFYWEDMAPTDIYAKKDGTTLYLRSTQPDTSYVKGTQWNDAEITNVVIEKPIAPSTCKKLFYNCTSLKEIENIENLHTENVENMEGMFQNCSDLSSLDLKYFDTKSVTNMREMFRGCTDLCNLNLNFLDTRNVNNMKSMFSQCTSLISVDLSSFNTINVIGFDSMFWRCSVLKTIYTSNTFVTNENASSGSMFSACNNLVGGLGTKYNSSKTNKEYARVDGGPDSSTPGYFTLKEN